MSDKVRAWLSVWSEMQMVELMTLPSPSSLASFKVQNHFTSLAVAYPSCPGKKTVKQVFIHICSHVSSWFLHIVGIVFVKEDGKLNALSAFVIDFKYYRWPYLIIISVLMTIFYFHLNCSFKPRLNPDLKILFQFSFKTQF